MLILVQNKVDICFLSETKIDALFPNQQFMINVYKLFRRDRNVILMKITPPKL